MANIIHRIGIKSSAKKVFEAASTIKGLAGWWTENVTGDASMGGKIEFRFLSDSGNEIGKMAMQVQKLSPEKEVRWQCVAGPAEWIGTDVTFDLSEQDGQIIVIFGHRNWGEEGEFMAHCSMKWATFLLSLREYVETGKGKSAPHDLKIDNWN